jgi:hypothetical protein
VPHLRGLPAGHAPGDAHWRPPLLHTAATCARQHPAASAPSRLADATRVLAVPPAAGAPSAPAPSAPGAARAPRIPLQT